MENNKLRQLTNEFFNKCEIITKDALYQFLVDNEWKIANGYEKSCHREDILFELDEMGYKSNKVPTDIIDDILERYEDHLADSEEWHWMLKDIISDYDCDLEEYKLEVE